MSDITVINFRTNFKGQNWPVDAIFYSLDIKSVTI